MDTRDIKGLLSSIEHFCTSVLEYDNVSTECVLKKTKYVVEVNCTDRFQAKASYSDKVEQTYLSEDFDYETPLDQASRELFERLEKVMKLPERELRFGLNLIGQSIEAGASYRTHVGLEFVASMKKEQEKTMLMLPDRTGQGVPEVEPAPEPVAGPSFDDEEDGKDGIPF